MEWYMNRFIYKNPDTLHDLIFTNEQGNTVNMYDDEDNNIIVDIYEDEEFENPIDGGGACINPTLEDHLSMEDTEQDFDIEDCLDYHLTQLKDLQALMLFIQEKVEYLDELSNTY